MFVFPAPLDNLFAWFSSPAWSVRRPVHSHFPCAGPPVRRPCRLHLLSLPLPMVPDRVFPSVLSQWSNVGRRLCLGVVILVLAFGLAACDSNGGGPPPSDLEGTYEIQELRFTVSGVNNFNILTDTLTVSDALPPSPRMEFFGGNATVNLIYRLEGSPGSSLLSGQFTTREGQVTADFSKVSEENRFEILLPAVVRLQREEGGARLVVNQDVRDVNLRDYSPDRYGGLTQNVNGTFRMELERVQPE